MATTGPRTGGTFGNDAAVGAVAWGSPGNAALEDGVLATAALALNDVTQYLAATNFGFAGRIPADAAINGIAVDVVRVAANQTTVKDNSVRIVKGGSVAGTEQATTTAWNTLTLRHDTYGGATDLWGLSWTPADIVASTFGIALSAKDVFDEGGGSAASIDCVYVTVYFTPASVTVF